MIFDIQGMFPNAQGAYSRAIGLLERANAADTPAMIDPPANLANLFYESSQFSRAETLLNREVAILNVVSAPSQFDSRSVIARGALARVYLSERKYGLASEAAQNVIKTPVTSDPALRLAIALGYSVLGAVSTRQHRLAAAETSLREALSLLEGVLDPGDMRIAEAIANLGLFYADSGDFGKAQPLLEDAHARLIASRMNTLFRRDFLQRLAQVERGSGRKQEAKELLKEGRSLTAASPAASISQYIVDASAWRQ